MATNSSAQIIAVHLDTPTGSIPHHHHITRVQWTSPTALEVSRADVVKAIRGGTSVYVKVGQDTAAVMIETVNGTDFIKTKPDSSLKDNLLSLPRF